MKCVELTVGENRGVILRLPDRVAQKVVAEGRGKKVTKEAYHAQLCGGGEIKKVRT